MQLILQIKFEFTEVPLDDALDPDVDHDADEAGITSPTVMDAEESTEASQRQHSDVGQFDKENDVNGVKALTKAGKKSLVSLHLSLQWNRSV